MVTSACFKSVIPLFAAHRPAAAASTSPLLFSGKDSYRKSAFDDLPIVYGPGVDPEAHPDYSPENIRLLLRHAHEMARTGHFGAVAVVEDGLKKGVSSGFRRGLIAGEVNYGFSEYRTICAEQSAMKAVITHGLRKSGKKPHLEALVLSANDPFSPKIHTVAPCCFCLDAMHTEQAMDPDTLMIGTARDPKAPERFVIEVRRLADYLPYKTEAPKPSATRHPVHSLPVDFSPAAKMAMRKRGFSTRDFKKTYVPTLIDNAESVYRLAKRNLLAERNGRYLGAAALFCRNNDARYITTGASLVATDRITQYADIKAIHDGLEGDMEWLVKNMDYAMPVRDDLAMVAYYSEEVDEPVNQVSLGLMNLLTKRADILLATIRDDRIVVRTLDEYQPIRYLKTRDVHPEPTLLKRISAWKPQS